MNLTVSVFSESFEGIQPLFPIKEFLIHPETYSKQGQVCLETLKKSSFIQKFQNSRLTLNFDMLFTDEQTTQILAEFEKEAISLIDSVRCLDLGLALAFREKFPELKVQLNLERGTHNFLKIKTLARKFGPKLEKVTLSNEIPFNRAVEYSEALEQETEVLGFGRLEIFYTPRPLLKNVFQNNSNRQTAYLSSLERPSSLRHTYLEDDLGGVMFYERDLLILDSVLQFEAEHPNKNIPDIRLDLYSDKHLEILKSANSEDSFLKLFLEMTSAKTTKGFFRVNKTEAQFKFLKNKHIKGHDAGAGEILEYYINRHLLIRTDVPLKRNEKLTLINPHGEKLTYKFEPLENQHSSCSLYPEGLYFCPWIKRAYPNSIIILNPDSRETENPG